MMQLIYIVLQFPFGVRVLIFLGIVLGIWRLLGRPLMYILSILPYLLRKLFHVFYNIIEIPVVFLHRNFGSIFYTLDNLMSEIGCGIDRMLDKCYQYFHSDYKFKTGRAFVLASICYAVIVLPSYVYIEADILNVGKEMYENAEKRLSENVLKHISEQIEMHNSQNNQEANSQIKLIVQGVKSSLYVRDVPSEENGMVLDYLYNGDQVVWLGDMVFVDWSNGKKIALVKVVTANNVEGWSRLDYLYPEGYVGMGFEMKSTSNGK